MDDSSFTPSSDDQINLCLAYLSYIGETHKQKAGTAQKIYDIINSVIPQIPTLCVGSDADWRIVWGPVVYTYKNAHYQDSGMFVAQQISNPVNYVVAIRGTNSKAFEDWLKEDFDVLARKHWPEATGAKISHATHNGLHLLVHHLIPDSGLPGAGQTIEEFLQSIAGRRISLSFTGHSLGGALAPTLALFFKQSQSQAGGWDPDSNVTVTCTAFAGSSAGNVQFADYSNGQFGANPCRRIHNTHDIVPRAWNRKTFRGLKTIYDSAGISMPTKAHIALDLFLLALTRKAYTQIDNSLSFEFPINKSLGDSYFKQVGFQHVKSYPLMILGHEAGTKFIDLVNGLK